MNVCLRSSSMPTVFPALTPRTQRALTHSLYKPKDYPGIKTLTLSRQISVSGQAINGKLTGRCKVRNCEENHEYFILFSKTKFRGFKY